MKAGPWSAGLLAVGLALLALGCGRSGFSIAPTTLRVEVSLTGGTIGQNLLVLTWTGQWLTDTPGSQGSQGGATTDSYAFGLPPASQTAPPPPIIFPDSHDLRPGIWQISLSVVGGNPPTPPIIDTTCSVEIRPNTVNVIPFTQGLPSCSAPLGLVP
jgi:hypothetical protein